MTIAKIVRDEGAKVRKRVGVCDISSVDGDGVWISVGLGLVWCFEVEVFCFGLVIGSIAARVHRHPDTLEVLVD